MQIANTASLYVSKMWDAISRPSSTRSSWVTFRSGTLGFEDPDSTFDIELRARMGVLSLLFSAIYHIVGEMSPWHPSPEAPQPHSHTRNGLWSRNRILEIRGTCSFSLSQRAGPGSKM